MFAKLNINENIIECNKSAVLMYTDNICLSFRTRQLEHLFVIVGAYLRKSYCYFIENRIFFYIKNTIAT